MVALILGLVAVAGCGADPAQQGGRPTVAVTTTVLGALVRDLAGSQVEVRVILPNGVDPHDFQPSAKDVEALNDADLIVANGLGLEEGLDDAIDAARADGVPVVVATDHVALIGASGSEGDEGARDPHVWMDPTRMRDLVAPLAAGIEEGTGRDLGGTPRRLERRLTALDARIRRELARVPADRRRLVTGHESLGYYADRYDLRVVGAIVPGLSSQAGISASRLTELAAAIRREGVPAIFTETGFPPDVAEAIAREAGVRVIPVATEALPADGSYETFMEAATEAIAGGLAGSAGP